MDIDGGLLQVQGLDVIINDSEPMIIIPPVRFVSNSSSFYAFFIHCSCCTIVIHFALSYKVFFLFTTMLFTINDWRQSLSMGTDKVIVYYMCLLQMTRGYAN